MNYSKPSLKYSRKVGTSTNCNLESRGHHTAKPHQSHKSPVRETKDAKETIVNIETANYLNSKVKINSFIEVNLFIVRAVERD